MSQKLLLDSLRAKLEKNAAATEAELATDGNSPDHYPVVKFFNPCGAATWLITEIDDEGRMFGLGDLGYGTPELGYTMLSDLQNYTGQFGLKIERDIHFKAKMTIGEYAELARQQGRIAA